MVLTLSSISLSVSGTVFGVLGAGAGAVWCRSWLNLLVVGANTPIDGRGTRELLEELGRLEGRLEFGAMDGRPPPDGPEGIGKTAAVSLGAGCCTAAK